MVRAWKNPFGSKRKRSRGQMRKRKGIRPDGKPREPGRQFPALASSLGAGRERERKRIDVPHRHPPSSSSFSLSSSFPRTPHTARARRAPGLEEKRSRKCPKERQEEEAAPRKPKKHFFTAERTLHDETKARPFCSPPWPSISPCPSSPLRLSPRSDRSSFPLQFRPSHSDLVPFDSNGLLLIPLSLPKRVISLFLTIFSLHPLQLSFSFSLSDLPLRPLAFIRPATCLDLSSSPYEALSASLSFRHDPVRSIFHSRHQHQERGSSVTNNDRAQRTNKGTAIRRDSF